ncbi:ROK family protein [Parablautia intestinalis]|jgi:glucokinase|uniref:Glucokinase n=1 Tax=Parablautia intestinalis TaxID=2320100 RepID=A0A3A9AHP3_9FIRM|nr:ROK family glucokinase [Parablautia intestinalis]MCI8615781.1 ROK family glucokinase [Lachnospiraceae bacterium]MDE7047164.1 ROK family glucokinase [Lachnospiraceae bacterium]RKI90869.1 ROK family protein [Parablautia intestinalis]
MSKYVFGVDIGGTTVKLGFFDVEGTLLDKWEIPTRTQDNGSYILPDIAKSIQEKMEEKQVDASEVAGVGVGAPGPIDSEGVVHKAVNLGWDTFSIKDTLEDILHVPVKAGNDANVAALGEMWKGGGQGSRNLIVVTLGTGVGGGIIVEGRVLTGAIGAGGEIGHIHVEDEEDECCGCGNKGCLEQYASATGITRLAVRKLAASDKESMLREGEVSAKTVFDAVKQNDALAIEVAEEFGKYLGDGLSVIAGVVNPETIVIGGGVSKAGEVLMDYIKPHFIKNVFHANRDVKFALATLGNDAGIYGSAKLVLEA